MIFDTHLHLIDKSRLTYPWLAGVPALNRDASYADYARIAQRVGITSTLHMEVDVAPQDQAAETDMVRSLMAQPGSLMVGAIASCRPEEATFAQTLESLLADPIVMGLRRVLHVVPDETSRTALFRQNVARLAGTRLTFDLCMLSRQLELAAELVDACPDVAFVLDHGGVPDIKGRDFAHWAPRINALAERPNVTAKISGFVAYADPDTWVAADVRPYFEAVIEAFGWDRVVWGSDSPVCTLGSSLEGWVATTHLLLEGCSTDERSALLSGNACKLWPSARG